MKTYFTFLVLLAVVSACSPTTSSDQAAKSNEWKEMDEFHMIMAETFHPYMDSANLQPAIEKASALAAAANKWKNAPLPAKVDNEKVKTKLQMLADLSVTLESNVKNGNEETIGATLNTLHDAFHDIQNEWYSAGSSKHEEAHGHEHDGHDHSH